MTVFIKRYPSRGELPNKGGNYYSDKGLVFFNNVRNEFEHYYLKDEANIQYWLQEIELPSEEEVCKGVDSRYKEWQDKGVVSNINESAAYKAGLVDTRNFILNHLKTNTNE